MKSISKLIKYFDIYGKQVELNINGKKSSTSNFGGFCSILNINCFLVILLMNLYDFIFIRDPIITILSLPKNFSEINVFDSENFFISHIFIDTKKNIGCNSTPIWSSLLNFNITPVNSENGNLKNETNSFGEFSICESNKKLMNSSYASVYDKSYKFNLTNSMSCIDISKPFHIGGDILMNTSDIWASINVRYDVCKLRNRTENCLSNDPDVFEEYVFAIVYKNNYFSKEKSDGYISTFQKKMSIYDFDKDLHVKIKIKQNVVSSDYNLLYNIFPKQEKSYFVYEFEIFQISKKDKNVNTVNINHEFFVDDFVEITERRYIKLDEMLANVGSMVAIADFLTKFISQFFTEGNIEHSIYKQIFYIEKNNLFEFKNLFNFERFKSVNEFHSRLNIDKDNKKTNDKHETKENKKKKVSILNQEINDISNQEFEFKIQTKVRNNNDYLSKKFLKSNEDINESEIK